MSNKVCLSLLQFLLFGVWEKRKTRHHLLVGKTGSFFFVHIASCQHRELLCFFLRETHQGFGMVFLCLDLVSRSANLHYGSS